MQSTPLRGGRAREQPDGFHRSLGQVCADTGRPSTSSSNAYCTGRPKVLLPSAVDGSHRRLIAARQLEAHADGFPNEAKQASGRQARRAPQQPASPVSGQGNLQPLPPAPTMGRVGTLSALHVLEGTGFHSQGGRQATVVDRRTTALGPAHDCASCRAPLPAPRAPNPPAAASVPPTKHRPLGVVGSGHLLALRPTRRQLRSLALNAIVAPGAGMAQDRHLSPLHLPFRAVCKGIAGRV